MMRIENRAMGAERADRMSESRDGELSYLARWDAVRDGKPQAERQAGNGAPTESQRPGLGSGAGQETPRSTRGSRPGYRLSCGRQHGLRGFDGRPQLGARPVEYLQHMRQLIPAEINRHMA